MAVLTGDCLSPGAALGVPESELQGGAFVFGGSLTWVVARNRGWDWDCGLFPGKTCFGGRGGGRRTTWEGSAGASFGGESERGATRRSPSAPAGGGFATDESMTTIFPAPPFLTGKWVVGDGWRPVGPLEGKGGWEPLFGGKGLSAIGLGAWVDP